jgi:hypothetical protein
MLKFSPPVNDMDGMEFHPPRSIYPMDIHGVIGAGWSWMELDGAGWSTWRKYPCHSLQSTIYADCELTLGFDGLPTSNDTYRISSHQNFVDLVGSAEPTSEV